MATNGQNKIFSAIVEYDAESKMFVGSVIGTSGAHTQATTLDKLRENI
ncbi:hypothetical protein HUU59_07815 [bacterium]|nr:hypothetical protein [bacterium]